MPARAIRQDLSATELRRLARHEPDRRAAMRPLAIAHALDGFSRAEAARLAGMERQALRDAVIRYNAEGTEGLHDRPRSGRPEGLTPGQQAALKAWVLRGPDPERELAILRVRAPGVPELLARQVAAATEAVRGFELYKPPGVAETIDWANSLATLGRTNLDEHTVEMTLGSLLKYREDQERVRGHGVADIVRSAIKRGA